MPPGRDTFRGTNLGIHDKAAPTEKIFNVLNFGAKPDGRRDNTEVNVITYASWMGFCNDKDSYNPEYALYSLRKPLVARRFVRCLFTVSTQQSSFF